ncbi:MAG: hypothetical protein PHV36_08535 [Elusimicrobiales bacterium]|nr:hypothetical protein [Elusimicrobiales bacterium]
MKMLNTIAAAAVIAAVFSGIGKAGNFETDLQSLKGSMPAPAAAEQVSMRGEKLSGLGLLSNKMVAVKGKMERVDLALWDITRKLEHSEGGSIDEALPRLMSDLKEATAASKALDAVAAGAIASTPKTPDTVAVAKLLLANVAEYTDNDETIALIRLETIMTKYPEYKDAVQPHISEYMKSLEALGRAGDKIMKLSGLLGGE